MGLSKINDYDKQVSFAASKLNDLLRKRFR